MSETTDDSTATDGPAIPIAAGLRYDASNFSSIGADTDRDFLIWDHDQKRLDYLGYLYGKLDGDRDEVELDFAVKERLTQLLRLERQLAAGGSNDKLTPIKSILPAAARRVETVRQRNYGMIDQAWLWFSAVVIFISFGVAEILIAYFAQGLILVGLIYRDHSRYRHPVANRFAVYLALALSSMCIVAFIFTGLFKRGQYPGIFLELAGGVGLVIVLFGLSFWSFVTLIRRILLFRYQHIWPSEVLLVDLVDLASSALPISDDSSKLPRSESFQTFRRDSLFDPLRSQPRRFIDQLEAAAKRAEWLFARNIPRRHSDLRPWILDRAQRVAAVLRAHKRVLIEEEVRDPARTAISSSLLNGAIYVAQKNWDAFLVVQPEPIVRSLLRRFGSRIALAAFLAVGALAIPWLFPSLVLPTTAMEFRATLLVTAAFSLFRPDLDKAREAFISFRH
jgi:hypothetical protein